MATKKKLRNMEGVDNKICISERRLLVAVLQRALIDLLEIGVDSGGKRDLHCEKNMHNLITELLNRGTKLSERAEEDDRPIIEWFRATNNEPMSFNAITHQLNLEVIQDRIRSLI